MRAASALVSVATPYESLRTAAFAQLELLPYQLEPALVAVRHSALRLLLADEVGLGKTIQAGLILSELRARDLADRTLILTPAGLRDQWADELTHRFAIPAEVVDLRALGRSVATRPRGENPWAMPGVRIVSFDFVKRPEVLRALDSIVWDLLVIDEAHAATPGTDRGSAIRRLGVRSRRVILLTATPHAGDDTAFTALCDVGRLSAVGDRAPVMMFRRSRADVGLTVTRRAHLLLVRQTPEEHRMHALLDDYVQSVWRSATRRADEPALMAMVVLKKRSLSSATSLAISLDRRIHHLTRIPAGTEWQLGLPLSGPDEEDGREDEEPIALLAPPGMANLTDEVDSLSVVRDAARRSAAHESKLRRLRRLLASTDEPVLVFTEYRDTLIRLAEAVASHAAVAVLHGGLDRVARRAAEAAFTSGTARVLLATDAAGEGLNLQHTCRLVVNYELPWNPIRLEQRVGRVDRIGQQRVVHAVHLIARHTAEADLLARLVARLERIRASVGHSGALLGQAPERVIAEAMLHGGSASRTFDTWLRPAPVVPNTPPGMTSATVGTPDRHELRNQACRERSRLSAIRRVRGAARRGSAGAGARSRDILDDLDRTSPWVTLTRHSPFLRRRAGGSAPSGHAPTSSEARGLLCIFRTRIVDAGGRLAETSLVAARVTVAGMSRGSATRHTRRLAQRLLYPLDARIHQVVRREVDQRMSRLRPVHEAAVARIRARERMIAAQLEMEQRTPGAQAGLFDRRALDDAARRRHHRERQRQVSARRLAALDVAGKLTLSDAPVLILAIGDSG